MGRHGASGTSGAGTSGAGTDGAPGGGASHGPGLTWLAERAGCTPDELLADPRRLLAALADAERAVTGLGGRLRSPDDAVRADAEHEADRLRRMFVASDDPADRLRSRVLGALRDAADRVRAADDEDRGRARTDGD